MSEESRTPDLVELGRRIFDVGRRCDVGGLMGFYRPEVILEMPDAGLTFEGLPAIRRFYEDFFELWDTSRLSWRSFSTSVTGSHSP